MKEKLYIIGAGSVGGHVALNIEDYTNEFEIAGFFDDDPEKIGTKHFGFKVLGAIEEVIDIDNASIAIGIAFPKAKQKIIERLSGNLTLNFPSLIHRRAWVSKKVSIGNGCIIYPGTTINYGSKIDDFVVLNMNCSLGHHTQVGGYSSFAPSVSTGGHTIIERSVEVGIGASTLQGVHIGAGSTVGGQSMVIDNIKEGSTAVGVPAKMIQHIRNIEQN